MTTLTHKLFQQKIAAPHSDDAVLRRILHPDDEVWYWDPTSNVVDKRAAKRLKKDKKEKKDKKDKQDKKEKKCKRDKKEKEKKMDRERAEPSENRKALCTSDDICWRKAEVNRTVTRDESITLGTVASEVIEKNLHISGVQTIKVKSSKKTYPLHHSISFNVFRRSKDSSSSASTTSSESEDESDTEEARFTIPQTICKLRQIALRSSTKSTPSSSSTSSATTTSTPSSVTTTSSLDSALSGSTCSSTTTSSNNSPVSSPRLANNGSPIASPRANTITRMKLHLGLRRSIQAQQTATCPISPISSPRQIMDEITNGEPASPLSPRALPPPLSLDDTVSSDDKFELRSIDETTDDSGSESTEFWARERTHRPPSSRIPPTPYFDLILRSFDECL